MNFPSSHLEFDSLSWSPALHLCIQIHPAHSKWPNGSDAGHLQRRRITGGQVPTKALVIGIDVRVVSRYQVMAEANSCPIAYVTIFSLIWPLTPQSS